MSVGVSWNRLIVDFKEREDQELIELLLQDKETYENDLVRVEADLLRRLVPVDSLRTIVMRYWKFRLVREVRRQVCSHRRFSRCIVSTLGEGVEI